MALLGVALFLSVLLGWFGRAPAPEPPARVGLPGSGTATVLLPGDAPIRLDPGAAVVTAVSEAAHGVLPSDAAERAGVEQQRAEVEPPGADGQAVASVRVAVLNGTRIEGLAARTAADLGALGWDVPVVDDFVGDVPASTVFYPSGRVDAARALAAAVGVERVRPAPPAIPERRLTLVLADEVRVGR